jgi:hypothetical protein
MSVLNSFCFDFALRCRISGTSISFTYILPVPVPSTDAVNRLPRIPTLLGWEEGIRNLIDNEAHWPALWHTNRAVAEAYGLNADDFDHILDAFPVFARKRRKFMEFLRAEVEKWA